MEPGVVKMYSKINEIKVRETLELLLNKATTQEDFNTIKYAIDDYLDEGYPIQNMVIKYNEAQKIMLGVKNG